MLVSVLDLLASSEWDPCGLGFSHTYGDLSLVLTSSPFLCKEYERIRSYHIVEGSSITRHHVFSGHHNT